MINKVAYFLSMLNTHRFLLCVRGVEILATKPSCAS
ncbi:unnamed protein product [Brassica oleracea]